MQQFEWLHERLAHNTLDKTITLTFSQSGSSLAPTGTTKLKHLLNEFARLRKLQRDDAHSG